MISIYAENIKLKWLRHQKLLTFEYLRIGAKADKIKNDVIDDVMDKNASFFNRKGKI